METTHFKKAGILMLLLVVTLVISWEFYLRNNQFKPAFDDGKELWSDKRAQIYLPSTEATVFIGSSRIKYDLDIETWESITGNKAIQLAIEGNSPLPVLDDIAGDKNFKGRVVVDVTEGLFFTTESFNIDFPKEHIEYHNERTPAQRVSFPLNKMLESQLVFLDRDNFSLNALLKQLPLKKREGVFAILNEWPAEFGRVTSERQCIMMDRFLVDTMLQKKVTGNWLFFDKMNTEKPAEGRKMDSILTSVQAAVDKIRSRGGDVLFVRTPSSGYYWPNEQKNFPRAKYWERILAVTKSKGIHFTDYKETDHFICPEWSHLSRPQAIEYTKSFINILKEKGWTFDDTEKKL